jgi:hypothetical protein
MNLNTDSTPNKLKKHSVLGIRILTDLHQSEKPDPAADQHQSRIKVKVKVLWLWSLKWGHGGSWRLEGSKWSRVWWSYGSVDQCMVADWHHFDEELNPDPDHSEKRSA